MDKRQPSVSDLAATLQKLGVQRLYLSAPIPSNTPKPMTNTKKESQPRITNLRVSDPKVVAEKQRCLDELAESLQNCQACRLGASRNKLVYGIGNPDADLMFIGEGPGAEEDRQGIPFVGRAGQLLTDMIVKGMGVRREDIYIANTIKCRPPENRNPEADEMQACWPNLERQIEIIAPKVIVGLGAVAVRGLLDDKTGITRLHGQWREFNGIAFMPTFHPAYLLRNPPAKKDCWEDLKKVIAYMNEEV